MMVNPKKFLLGALTLLACAWYASPSFAMSVTLGASESIQVRCQNDLRPVVTAAGTGLVLTCGATGAPVGTQEQCALKYEAGYYRVILGGQSYASFWNDEASAIQKIKVLREAGLCEAHSFATCSLRYSGGYYRVFLNDEPYVAFWNNESAAIEKVQLLRSFGVCQ